VTLADAPSVVPLAPLLRAPWRDLGPEALLAHLRSPRGVQFDATIDPQEIGPARIAGILLGRFEFNGETHALPDPVAWLANPSRDVEWHILLHKFYYAVGLAQAWQASGDTTYALRWVQLVDSWMQVTPPGFIAADVTGRRVQNWIYSLQGLLFQPGPGGDQAPLEPDFVARLLASLHTQVQFLCENLTPKRNHRTLELLAIFLAGVVFPEFEAAAHWRAFALAQTRANIQADLLADGVHCELSTDYHHLALRNWLQVRQLAARNGVPVPAEMDLALEKALQFALHVHAPSGVAPSFSDGDARGYLPLLALGAELYGREDMRFVATQGRQGRPPAQRAAHFDASGYHVLRSAWGDAASFTQAQHLVFDCGPLGEGNHGHFDALHFELAAFGRPLVVDPGRYTYSEAGEVNWRVHFRGTAAHNTVCVDGRHQTRYAPKPIKEPSRHAQGSVRHKIGGPAPDTVLLERAEGPALDLLHGRAASHEYDAVHERCIVFVDRCYRIVSDWLRAPTEHDYALGFQLGASAQGRSRVAGDGAAQDLLSPQLRGAQLQRDGQVGVLEAGWVSALYGHKEAAPVWRTRARGRNVDFDTVLRPWDGQDPGLRLRAETAQGEDGRRLVLLCIRTEVDGQPVCDRWLHTRGAGPGPWHWGGLAFHGRWVHWRVDTAGRVLRALSHAGASLQGPQ
jgi:uncharacterized heparinase superfamily protein